MNKKFTRHNQSPRIGALWIKRLFRFFIHQDAVRLVLATFFLFSAMAVSAAPIGTITTVAGNRVQGYNGDDIPATSANLSGPSNSMAVDSLGNLYFADEYNNRVRKVDAGTGIISTVAGNGTATYVVNNGGQATSASISRPRGVAIDGFDNLYVSDRSPRVLKVVLGTGVITTIAGGGSSGGNYSGDGSLATKAGLSPGGMATDSSGNLYIADTENNRVRKITAATGIITTLAGDGSQIYAGDNIPATTAALFLPSSVAVDGAGNLYIADTLNHLIRKVSAGTGIITTVAGSWSRVGGRYGGDGGPATSAYLSSPTSLVLDGYGNLYFVDSGNQRVRKVAADTGIITTVAGSGIGGYSGDGGPATSASLRNPTGLTLDKVGNLYIDDHGNYLIRKVNLEASAPAAPLEVSATAGIQQATISFSAPASDGGAAIDSYTASCTDGSSTLTATGAGSPITITDLTAGVTYACSVTAHNTAGNSPASASVSVTPDAPFTIPTAPLSVSATPGVQQAAISFSAPASDGGAAIDNYIAICTGDDSTMVISGTSSPITVIGMTAGVTYTCSVTAHNAAGDGPASASVSVTPVGVPGAPQSVSATSGVRQATVSFSAPTSDGGAAIDSYVASCTAGGTAFSASGSASPLTVAGLTGGVTYACSVIAHNAVGYSPASAAASVMPVDVPAAPQSVSAVRSSVQGMQQAIVSFSAPASDGGAAIDSYTASCTAGGSTLSSTGAASPLTVAGLASGVTYTCGVTAHNAVGDGPASASVSLAPGVAREPTKPKSVSAVPGAQQATVSFGEPASDGGAAIDSYTASCTAGGVAVSATGASSPITVTGLTSGAAYECSVIAHNAVGSSKESQSVSVTPN